MASAPFFPFSTWIPILDGDDEARRFFDRHYSRTRYADGREPKLFVGPGQKMVLTTPCRRALFVWRKFISGDGQQGVNRAIFRNEGAGRASYLIGEAEALAHRRWPGERFYTYVNPRKVQSGVPGWCFILAGWEPCGSGIVSEDRIITARRTGFQFRFRLVASHTSTAPVGREPTKADNCEGCGTKRGSK